MKNDLSNHKPYIVPDTSFCKEHCPYFLPAGQALPWWDVAVVAPEMFLDDCLRQWRGGKAMAVLASPREKSTYCLFCVVTKSHSPAWHKSIRGVFNKALSHEEFSNLWGNAIERQFIGEDSSAGSPECELYFEHMVHMVNHEPGHDTNNDDKG